MDISDINVYTFRRDMPDDLSDTTVVLIDTHNFTTTAIEALKNGAKEIVPLTSIEGGVPRRVTVLAGDDNTEMKNHPQFMSKNNVDDERVGINSWNGSSAVHEIRGKIKQDVTVCLGSLTNAPAIANELQNSESITFILAGSGGNCPPEDILTMQCIMQCVYTDLDNLPMICSFYEQLYTILVLGVYDTMYENKEKLGPFGRPQGHATEIASQIGSQSIIPKMNNNGGFEI